MDHVVNLPPNAPPLADGTKRGGWWHRTEQGDRIICDLCPRACALKAGDRGFCFVRENRDGEMVLTTYGRSTGFCIDPIEKKPLNHFLPGTSILSFGTAGCNLACKFCQNWSISKSREVARLSELATPEAIAAACQQMECRSVAFTYNDPIIWAEYAIDVAAACRALGIKTVAVTAGYITPVAREPFFAAMDAANVDLKAFTEEFYQRLTLSHLAPVLETLEWLKRETDVWFEITNLVIPHANDTDDEFRRICDFVLDRLGDDVPLHFTAFHPDFRLRDRERTPHETLLQAYQLARDAGVKYVYVGNVNDARHQSTYCAACRGLVIERDWYALGAYHLDGDRCAHCGAPIAGVFDASPGNWGRRRLPVQISRFAQQPPTARLSPTSGPDHHQQGEQHVSTDEQNTSAKAGTPVGVPTLTDQQKQAVHKAASEIVAAAVCGYRAEASDPTLAGAGTQTVFGSFVTLKRHGRLRGCCGFIGRPSTLLAALTESAVTTATRDARLPAISPIELEHLTLDVSLLHSLTPIEVTGTDRIKAVEVGKHGLQIKRGSSRGLLLPSVATENDLDAETFLRHVAIKAGLPPTTWKEDNTKLWTFEGLVFGGPLEDEVIERFRVERPRMFTHENMQHLAEYCRHNIVALVAGGTPTFYVESCPDGNVQGITISVTLPRRDEPARFGQLSIRPGLPLQSTALEMCKLAAHTLSAGGFYAAHLNDMTVDVAVLYDSAMHGTVAEPSLEGFDPRQRALLVAEGNKSAWIFDPERTADELLQATVDECQARLHDAASITSFEACSTTKPIKLANLPRAWAGADERPAAVAGMFYPGAADELSKMVDELYPEDKSAKQSWRGALIPHAGLKYSGRLAAAVLDRIDFPETVIIIGPKHTRQGVEWAIAPHAAWNLPGITLASDSELARQLADAIPDLQLDAGAHQKEHAIEVGLPLLARVAPNSRVVGITIGRADLDSCHAFADGLAETLRQRDDRVLLVISSDLNHFASDEETRRLDKMAMSALEKMQPEEVYHTVRDNHISMCGVLPAVIVLDALHKIAPLTTCERVGYATSADTTGDTSRVVGYGGMLFS